MRARRRLTAKVEVIVLSGVVSPQTVKEVIAYALTCGMRASRHVVNIDSEGQQPDSPQDVPIIGELRDHASGPSDEDLERWRAYLQNLDATTLADLSGVSFRTLYLQDPLLARLALEVAAQYDGTAFAEAAVKDLTHEDIGADDLDAPTYARLRKAGLLSRAMLTCFTADDLKIGSTAAGRLDEEMVQQINALLATSNQALLQS